MRIFFLGTKKMNCFGVVPNPVKKGFKKGTWWGVGTAVVSTAGSMYSASKNKPKSQSLVPMQEQWQTDVGAKVGEKTLGTLKDFTPGSGYPGQVTAGTTPQERTTLEQLTAYLSDPKNKAMFGGGQQQLIDTLSGKFMDPEKSPYLQGMEKIGKRQLEEQIDTSRRSRGAGPSFFHTQTGAEESKLRGNYLDTMAALTGKFMGDERDKMFQAGGQGIAAGDPLTSVAAGQSYGALQRTLEQNEMDKRYQDWLTGRGEKQQQIQLGAQGGAAGTEYGIKDFESQPTDNTGQIVDLITSIAGIAGNRTPTTKTTPTVPSAARGGVLPGGYGQKGYVNPIWTY